MIIGLAKKPDRLIFQINKKINTIKPDSNHPGFNLLRLIRDEAHRYAHKYHLLLRKNEML